MGFRVLGPIEHREDGSATGLGGPKQRAVLAMLVSGAGGAVSIDALIAGVWGDDASSSVRRSLYTYISNLRATLGTRIERVGNGYRLEVEPAEIDARVFERLVDEARTSLGANPAGAAEKLRTALSLWYGPPYADLIDVPGLQDEIRRLEDLRLLAVETKIDAELATGRHRAVIGELEALTAEHPFREGFQARHMIALYRDGRQAEALRAYRNTREHLAAELGVDPSPELQYLEERILAQDPALMSGLHVRTEEVAFLFTGVEDAAALWDASPDHAGDALAAHDRLLAAAVEDAGGRLTRQTGDGIVAAFGSVSEAAGAAVEGQRALAADGLGEPGALTVRMALDVGEVDARGLDYFGAPLNRGARLMSAAHGGQIVMSRPASDRLLQRPGFQIRSLGEHRFAGLATPQPVFQLVVPGLPDEFPVLRLDAPAPDRGRRLGDAIRGYEIRQRVGAGRFGVVYRAYQPSVGREVAVKVIRPEYSNHPVFIRRFEGEARMAAKLAHPHIVPLFDFWRDHEGAYLVMPYLAGGSLAGANRPLPTAAVAGIVRQIGAALAHAHRQGVIHGDVWPSNILLDDEGNAYLTDFGSAVRAVERAGGVSSPSSQTHRAPEDVGDVDERTDIYGLTTVAVELLTGHDHSHADLSMVPADMRVVIERGLDADPDERFRSIEQVVQAFDTVAGGARTTALAVPVRNPYKGLAAFDESDGRDFYGRDAEIAALVRLVEDHRFVAVVGPSGSGKSSLVRAGLAPALRAGRSGELDGRLVVTAVPGTHPFDELAIALAGVATVSSGALAAELGEDDRGLLRVGRELTNQLGGELVLVIDQFEELYSLVSDEETRSAFIAALLEAAEDPDSRMRVVATIRADFFDQPLLDDRLGPVVSGSHLALSVPGPDQLLEAVERPALGAGVDLEPGLAHQIVADVRDQPGGLPLMQFVLKDLVDRAHGAGIGVDAYTDAGGVAGALSRRATETYESLDPMDRRVAEQIFVRLVTVSEDADDVRRRVRRSELESIAFDRRAVGRVLDAFGEARLLTFDRDPVTRGPTVEVAHEALLREWELHRRWVGERREALLTHRRLAAALEDWRASGRDDDHLPTGGRLIQFEEWASDPALTLARPERDFLQAAVERRDRETAERRRRRRAITTGFATAALVAAILAVVTWVQRGVAREEASLAQARELIAHAEDVLSVDPDLSGALALHAIEAFQMAGDIPGEAVTALREAIADQRVRFRVPGGRFVAAHPDGNLLATADGNDVAVWDIDTGEVVERYSKDGAESAEAAFSPDGNLLAVAFLEQDAPVTVWDRTTGASFDLGSGTVTDLPVITFSPDGELLAFGSMRRGVEVWAVSGPTLRADLDGFGPDFSSAGLMSHGFCVEGEGGYQDCEVRIVEPGTGKLVGSFPSDVPPAFTAWSPDGDRIVAADQNTAVVRDAETGDEISRTAVGRVYAPRWLPGGDRFVATGEEGPRVFDAATGEVLLVLAGQDGGSDAASLLPGGELLASPGLGQDTVVFDLSELGGLEMGGWLAPLEKTHKATIADDGRAIVSDEGSLVSADSLDGSGMVVLEGAPRDESGWFPLPSRDGSLVGMARPDGRWVVRRTDSGEVLYQAPPGWIVHGVDAKASSAVISRDPPCETSLVSLTDDTAPVELAAGCLGLVEFSPDGSLVVTHNLDVTAHPYATAIFDAETGELLRTLEDHPYDGIVADFTPDGSELLVVSVSGTLTVFELEALFEGAPLEDAARLVIPAHDDVTVTLRVSPDGSMAFTSTRNDSLKLWSLETGELLSEFEAETPPRTHITGGFHPTEPWLMVASPPNQVRIHTLDVDRLIEIARDRFTRDLTEAECQLYLRQPCEA